MKINVMCMSTWGFYGMFAHFNIDAQHNNAEALYSIVLFRSYVAKAAFVYCLLLKFWLFASCWNTL